MTHLKAVFAIGMAVIISLVTAGTVLAAGDNGKTYHVTITNLSKKQPLTPPLVISHKGSFKLFEAGQSASDELIALAEGGDVQPLMALLGTRDDVFDYMAGDGLILPGGSAAIEIKVKGHYRNLSLASMLAATNDAFIGVAGTRAPYRSKEIAAVAYDAGSEANTELCTDVPALPCADGSNPNLRVIDGAEGFIYVHNGIHGGGDLDTANMDWRNPVAKISIKRLR